MEAPAKKVFISYSHVDEEYRAALEGHLSSLRREAVLEIWHDRMLAGGDHVDRSVIARMSEADVVLFLVSSDFLSSRYCMDVEMEAALAKEAAGQTRIIPVILRPCDWHSAPFGRLLAAPRDGRPVSTWPNRDEALLDVAQTIRMALIPKKLPGGIAAANLARSSPFDQPDRTRKVAREVYGRDAEISRISGALSAVCENGAAAKFVLIGGEAGTGKSALTGVLCEAARSRGLRVLSTACEPFHEGMSLFPVRELVRQACAGRQLSEVIGDLYGHASVEVSLASLSNNPLADPETRRDATVGTFANLLYGLARGRDGEDQPLVVCLDDLESIDTGTADALMCLIARRGEGPLLVVGAYRTDLLGNVKTSSKALARLITAATRAADGFEHLRLDNLDVTHLPALVGSVLGGDLQFSTRFFERLHQETNSNPLFVREVLHALSAETGGEPPTIGFQDGSWRLLRTRAEWRMPESIEAAIQARLDMLDPQHRAELERAAVVGPRFSFEAMRQLSDLPSEHLLATLEELISFDLIREVQSSGDAFVFTHGKIREVLYSSMSRSRRRLVHASVAEWMLACNAVLADNWSAMIADHLYEAGRYSEACPLLLESARAAMAAFSPMEAIGVFRNAVAAGNSGGFPEGESPLRIALEEIEALKQANDYDAALELAGSALMESAGPESYERGWAHNHVGDVLRMLGRTEDAVRSYEEAEAIGRRHGFEDLVLETVADLAELSCREFEHASGTALARAAAMKRRFDHYLDEEVRLAALSQDRLARGRALRNAAKRLRMHGDLEGAIRNYEQALAFEPPGASPHRVLISYAKTLRLIGKDDRAMSVIDRVLEWSRQVGAVRSEAIARQHRGIMLFLQADAVHPDARDALLDAAASDLGMALRLHEEIEYKNGQRETLMALGERNLLAGATEDAMGCFALSMEGGLKGNALLSAVADELTACGETGRADLVRRLAGAGANQLCD